MKKAGFDLIIEQERAIAYVKQRLAAQPNLIDSFPWDCVTGAQWVELLLEEPQFAKYCDWSKLNGRDWDNLLNTRPEFTRYADVERLKYLRRIAEYFGLE